MRSYFLDYAMSRAEVVLARLLPRDGGCTLYGPDDSVIARFEISHAAISSKPIVEYGQNPGDAYLSIFISVSPNTSIQADVDDDGLDDRQLVLRILREVRDQCGGVLQDEDGNVLD